MNLRLLPGLLLAGVAALAACSGSNGGGGGDGGAGGEAAGGGATCGGTSCTDSEYCEYTPCDAAAETSGSYSCQARPTQCDADLGLPPNDSPVCGDDNQIYASECEAHKAGHGLGGLCEPPAGLFQCGDDFCDAQTEYCDVQSADCGPDSFASCVGYPDACTTSPPADCSCITESELCVECTHVGDAFTCSY